MADQNTPNPESGAAQNGPEPTKTIVGSDGLLDTSVIADASLREAASAINEVVKTRLDKLADSQSEIETLRREAEEWRAVKGDPGAIKFLYERTFGKPEPAPRPAETDDFDFGDDEVLDAKTLNRMAKKLSQATNRAMQAAIAQAKQEMMGEVDRRIQPIRSKTAESNRRANWAALVQQYPEAGTQEYKDEISKVLGSKRVGSDDYEAAYHIAHSVLSRRKEVENKATAAAKRGKAAAAAATANADPKRADPDQLRRPGSGWRGAMAAAEKKLGISLQG